VARVQEQIDDTLKITRELAQELKGGTGFQPTPGGGGDPPGRAVWQTLPEDQVCHPPRLGQMDNRDIIIS